MDNRDIARRLTDFAKYLEGKRRNQYRIQAYRRAAETVLGLGRPVEEILAQEGAKALEELPGIGEHLAFTIAGLVKDGVFRIVRRKTKTPKTSFRLQAAPEEGSLFSLGG